MFCFFMSSGRFRGPIDLNQDKPSGIVLLLNKVEAGNPGFLNAGFGIGESRRFEGLNRLRFDPHVNMNNEHSVPLFVEEAYPERAVKSRAQLRVLRGNRTYKTYRTYEKEHTQRGEAAMFLRKMSRFNSAGKNAKPAIMQVAKPKDIT